MEEPPVIFLEKRGLLWQVLHRLLSMHGINFILDCEGHGYMEELKAITRPLEENGDPEAPDEENCVEWGEEQGFNYCPFSIFLNGGNLEKVVLP